MTRYKPTEFIQAFEADLLKITGWKVVSASEEKRLYGGKEGSYRGGNVTFVRTTTDSGSFPTVEIMSHFHSAPNLNEVGSLSSSQGYQATYGGDQNYTGTIMATIVEGDRDVKLAYRIKEEKKANKAEMATPRKPSD